MKKIFLTGILISITVFVSAQISQGGLPKSLELNIKTSDEIVSQKLQRFNEKELLNEDAQSPSPFRYGVVEEVNIDIKEEGTKTGLTDGTIWQYTIHSEQAYSLGLFFNQYHVPEGAELYVFTQNGPIYGAFTEINNKASNTFPVADYPGNELTIEYYEPNNVDFQGKLVLSRVTQAYKQLPMLKSIADEYGLIDINCILGDEFQTEKHAVCKMTYTEGFFGYLCTGTLINNTRNDQTPYFLTAYHCIDNNEAAESLITYFNYEVDECGSNRIILFKSLEGSEYLAGLQGTDFSLLKLAEDPPVDYQPYFAGWSLSDTDHYNTTSIHHPSGKVKKVSVDFQAPKINQTELIFQGETESDVNYYPEKAFWNVDFDYGAIEGGSSGSALFNQDKKVIGQLLGGSGMYAMSYGRLGVSWDSLSTTNQQLKHWLDPDNTGVTELDGLVLSTLAPRAYFSSNVTVTCVNEVVRFKDLSEFSPTSWQWNISPSTFEFIEGTESSSQNPVAKFLQEGNYSVELIATKGANTDTLTIEDYISIGNSLTPLAIEPFEALGTCMSGFSGMYYKFYNADSFTINFDNNIKDLFSYNLSDKGALISLVENNTVNLSSASFDLTGYSGQCVGTSTYTINFKIVENDNIADAIPLEQGYNGYFSNECATTEPNEPNPSGLNCNTQITWCGCNVSDTILDNSIWFTFIGPESEIVSIETGGFDNQIAIYEANTASDILNNNYKIIAANDDYTGEPEYAAIITGASVEQGKKYWLQVDGSACGATGECFITLKDKEYIGIKRYNDNNINKISIYPNPAKEIISFQLDTEDRITFYSYHVIDISGSVIKKGEYNTQKNEINISALEPGYYILKLFNSNESYSSYFIKE